MTGGQLAALHFSARGRSIGPGTLGVLAIFLVAAATAFFVVRPFHAGQVGYDAAASVLYFDRIVAGRRLELFISVTPHPLLTLVYGVIHDVTGDWRPISWLAISVYALAIALCSRLVARLSGVVAGAFVAAALISYNGLLDDTSAAYAVEWAFLFWVVAALAVTSSNPRFGWAGVALCLAGLARYETVVLDGVIAVGLLGWLINSRAGRTTMPRSAWLLLGGFASVPIQMVHDWLLAGNPLYSLAVPDLGSQGLAPEGPIYVLIFLARNLQSMAPLVALAAIGGVRLIQQRRWAVLAGLIAIGPGICAFLLWLGFRGTHVSGRYVYPVDLAVIVAAAVGFGFLRVERIVAQGLRHQKPLARFAGVVSMGVIGAIALSPTFAPLDPTLTAKIRQNLVLHENADRARLAIDRALAAIPGVRDWPTSVHPDTSTLSMPPALLVPVLLGPQLAVDHSLPMTEIVGSTGPALSTDGTYPAPGQIVYHDPRDDNPPAAYHFLEVQVPTVDGRIFLVPILSDPIHRLWLVSIQQP